MSANRRCLSRSVPAKGVHGDVVTDLCFGEMTGRHPGPFAGTSRHAIAGFPNGGPPMDLGIAGRKAIVCASSRGLGRACAFRLAEAGCEVVVNGRDKAKTEATAAEIAKQTGAKVIPVVADVATADGQ